MILEKPSDLKITPTEARQLFITKQRLAGGAKLESGRNGIIQLIRELGCVQIDPISAVTPSQFLVLWSRMGNYDRSLIGELYKDRTVFEYWAHQLSILLMEDYSLFVSGMKSFPDTNTLWGKRVSKWITDNSKLEKYVISELRKKGALSTREFEDKSERHWSSSGWSNNRNVSRMLQFLFFQGKVMVSERRGNVKIWDLAERCLPNSFLNQSNRAQDEVEYFAVQRALKALGVATRNQIKKHFLRDSYPNLDRTLDKLESESKIFRVQFNGSAKQPWFIHCDDLNTLETIRNGGWNPKTVLLSPFDNLICDRTRTLDLFGFDYSIEIYVPESQRKYGYYILPVLHGDTFIARIDPVFKKDSKQLIINRVYAESENSAKLGNEVSRAVSDLAEFLGATSIKYDKVPSFWRKSLKSKR